MSDGSAVQSVQELYEALDELREAPYGTARTARAEELVETAERLGFDEALPAAMLELLTAYEYGTEIRKAPVLFSRVLKLHQDKPETFDDWAEHRLFWCFKWITWALVCLPEIPLATIEGWIENMRQHYLAAGKPLHAVHSSRFQLAAHLGSGVDAAYEQWATRPRDEFSDCEACEARVRGVYWANRGNHARALTEWEPVLQGKVGCAEEPASTMSHALISLVREGRPEDAASLHRSGYRAAKTQVGMDAQVGRHLEFLALTGNAARGLELLAENRHRFASTTDPFNQLTFLDGVRVLLTRLVAQGAAEAPVAGPDGHAYTVQSLLDEVAGQSDAIARRFDERNGTTCQGDFHRERCAREPLTSEPLPLGMRVAPVAAAPTAPVVPTAKIAQDFATLLAEARESFRLARPDHDALWDAVAARATEQDLDDRLRAELTDRLASKHIAKEEWDEAAELTRQSAELFDAANLPGRAVARRSRAEWCAFVAAEQGSEPSWAGFHTLRATADSLLGDERIAPEDYVGVWHSSAAAALKVLLSANEETFDAALSRFESENAGLLDAATRLEVPSRAAVAEAMRSNSLAARGEIEQALVAIESAIGYAELTQRPWSLPHYLAPQGHLLNMLNRFDEAAQALHSALRLAAEWPDPGFKLANVQMELAQNRLFADDLDAAISHLTSVASKFDQQGSPVAAANARAMLGQALLRAGRRTDGVSVLESLLTEDGEARLEQPQRAQLRLDLGRALMEQDEPRAAAEILAQLADFVADWPDQSVHTLIAGELVCALYGARLWEPGEKAIERALTAHDAAPNPAMVGKMLRTAAEAEYENRGDQGIERALELLRRADEVNEATEETDGRYRRWPEAALNADLRTLALARAGRHEEALAAAEQAIAAWTVGGDEVVGEYAQAMLNAAITEATQLGRPKQAVARLSVAITRCRSVGHEQAVAVLTRHAERFQREAEG
jgi:tetratricopeptide (TPR) repeat protein